MTRALPTVCLALLATLAAAQQPPPKASGAEQAQKAPSPRAVVVPAEGQVRLDPNAPDLGVPRPKSLSAQRKLRAIQDMGVPTVPTLVPYTTARPARLDNDPALLAFDYPTTVNRFIATYDGVKDQEQIRLGLRPQAANRFHLLDFIVLFSDGPRTFEITGPDNFRQTVDVQAGIQNLLVPWTPTSTARGQFQLRLAPSGSIGTSAHHGKWAFALLEVSAAQ